MFRSTLINGASGDPAVYLELKYTQQAALFDLGDIHGLLPRQMLKIGHIFVSHAHMDHFIGFDHLLRVCLGRDKQLHLYGPEGFCAHVENRLQGYNWNLVNNYINDFTIAVTEIRPDRCSTAHFHCRDSFRPRREAVEAPFCALITDTPFFTVRTDFLDHEIASLAFRFEEKERINIRKNILEDMALPKGKWLTDLKERVAAGQPPDLPIRVHGRTSAGEEKETWLPLGELQDRLVVIKAGQKLCYVTDAVGSRVNRERILQLAEGVDILYIEAPFLHRDVAVARAKSHLTARQAGILARIAGAKKLCLFHFSPKYKGSYELLQEEADLARESGRDEEAQWS